MKKTTPFLFVAILSFSSLKAESIYTSWDHAAFHLQQYKGEFKSDFMEAVLGMAYWRSLIHKKNPSDVGWVIYESLFVVGDPLPKALAKTFKDYPEMSVKKKTETLDDLAPLLWNKLYKYETYFIPQVICSDFCLIVESFIDEISILKQEEDSKLLSTLLYENSKILRAYYLYREQKTAATKSEFFHALGRIYENRARTQRLISEHERQ